MLYLDFHGIYSWWLIYAARNLPYLILLMLQKSNLFAESVMNSWQIVGTLNHPRLSFGYFSTFYPIFFLGVHTSKVGSGLKIKTPKLRRSWMFHQCSIGFEKQYPIGGRWFLHLQQKALKSMGRSMKYIYIYIYLYVYCTKCHLLI